MAKKNRIELRRFRRKKRIRRKIQGTAERPRMAVYRSPRHLYVQLVDDAAGKTLLSMSTRDKDIVSQKENKTAKARLLGGLLAKKAESKKIEKLVFDRKGYRYHGRVKALAEATRKAGLKF